MPRLSNQTPSYRQHRSTGRAVVTIDGHDIYLGPYGSKASRSEYDRVIGEWLANGRRSPTTTGTDITVNELVAAYWTHATAYYRKPDGTPTSEIDAIRLPVSILVHLYGRTVAAQFGPLGLETVRNAMIDKGWSRRSINMHVGRLKRLFGWGVAKELVPASVHHGLVTVVGLRAGRSRARETAPVRPVPDDVVDKTLPFLPRVVAAMVQIQRWTAARPGEICAMRTVDIDRSRPVWVYRPQTHKTEHHGHVRVIQIPQRVQAVLELFLNSAEPTAPIFSPAASEAARRAAATAARITPAGRGNAVGTNVVRKSKRSAGDQNDVPAYRRAIARACDAAFPPPAALAQHADETAARWVSRLTEEQRSALAKWRSEHRWHPHQLRHTAATEIAEKHGVEAAQHYLGHHTLDTTRRYAERTMAIAQGVAAAIG